MANSEHPTQPHIPLPVLNKFPSPPPKGEGATPNLGSDCGLRGKPANHSVSGGSDSPHEGKTLRNQPECNGRFPNYWVLTRVQWRSSLFLINRTTYVKNPDRHTVQWVGFPSHTPGGKKDSGSQAKPAKPSQGKDRPSLQKEILKKPTCVQWKVLRLLGAALSAMDSPNI